LNKIIAAGVKVNDPSVSPVIRQVLLHWGFQPTEEMLEQHKKKKK